MCDCLVALPAASATGCTLFAKNSDRPADEVQHIVWSPARHDTTDVATTYLRIAPHTAPTLACLMAQPDWCWGAETGVNTAGVAIGNETIYTTLDPRQAPAALTGLDLVRLGLERAHTATAATTLIIELIERYGQGGSGHDPRGAGGPKPYWNSFLIADPAEAYVLETSGGAWATEQVVSVRAISNRTTIAEFDAAHRHPRQPVERFVDARLAASGIVLAEQPVTVDALQAHLRSHDSCAEAGWSVCMHATLPNGEPVEVTASSMVAELRADGMHRVWGLTGSPCTGTYTEYSVPLLAAR